MNTDDPKTAAIRAGLALIPLDPATLLSWTTSPEKSRRETAKQHIRTLIAAGRDHIARRETEQALRKFANRNEPPP